MLRTLARSARNSSLTSSRFYSQKVLLPDLPYDYNALEPVISAQIMQIHHSKHHNAYVTNYNAAVEKMEEAVAKNDVNAVTQHLSALKFNGGGHINHSIFWTNLAPKNKQGGVDPEGPLLDAIKKHWGSLDKFIEVFNANTAAVQGSGWGWLGLHPATKTLEIVTCANQDPLKQTTGLIPLLGIDVWEHAYYLDYKNARPEYLKNIWKIVNWKNVAERYAAGMKL